MVYIFLSIYSTLLLTCLLALDAISFSLRGFFYILFAYDFYFYFYFFLNFFKSFLFYYSSKVLCL